MFTISIIDVRPDCFSATDLDAKNEIWTRTASKRKIIESLAMIPGTGSVVAG